MTRHVSWLLGAFVACGILFWWSTPTKYDPMGPPLNIDGVRVGMSYDEVSSKWGMAEEFSHMRPGGDPLSKGEAFSALYTRRGHVEFTSDGTVLGVRGRRLYQGKRLLVQLEDSFETVREVMGRPGETTHHTSGSYQFSETRFATHLFQFREGKLRKVETLKKFQLEQLRKEGKL